MTKQVPWHESIVRRLNKLADDFIYRETPTGAVYLVLLGARAGELANLILETETPKDLNKILAAWKYMREVTRLDNDYGITAFLEQKLSKETVEQSA